MARVERWEGEKEGKENFSIISFRFISLSLITSPLFGPPYSFTFSLSPSSPRPTPHRHAEVAVHAGLVPRRRDSVFYYSNSLLLPHYDESNDNRGSSARAERCASENQLFDADDDGAESARAGIGCGGNAPALVVKLSCFVFVAAARFEVIFPAPAPSTLPCSCPPLRFTM